MYNLNTPVDTPFTDLTYRICVGRHVANNSVFINVATILWAANVAALKDEEGKPVVPNTLENVNTGVIVLVLCTISFHPNR